MERPARGRPSLLPSRDVAKFTALVALSAIFVDAAVGHGLTWENDPYWTYWITKTFLIATIFGLGTAWFGAGEGRGAVITLVHTVVLTVYYWTLSPIGLPSSPDWLDLGHTWITGIPIHFGVIYLGYLLALWIWRRRARLAAEPHVDPRRLGFAALGVGVRIVALAGGLASAALLEFPGVTWFVVRLLITVVFLMAWWTLVGRDAVSAIVGGAMLALVWATYAQYLGPVGLPDTPLRIFTAAPPPAETHWLRYGELWGISFPIYLAAMVLTLLLTSGPTLVGGRGALRRPLAAAAALAAVVLTTGASVTGQQADATARIRALGTVDVETGPFYGDTFTTGTGRISMEATDQGGRVTPVPPHDRLAITASVEAAGHTYEVTVGSPMVNDALGRFTTWWGVGFHVWHHGKSGIGTPLIPEMESEVSVFGVGNVSADGAPVASGVPVHVMTASGGEIPDDATLEMDVGDPDVGPIPGLPDGHLRVLWPTYSGSVPAEFNVGRYVWGLVGLAVLLGAAGWLARRELPAR